MYSAKYLKYKQKYLNLKNMMGGVEIDEINDDGNVVNEIKPIDNSIKDDVSDSVNIYDQIATAIVGIRTGTKKFIEKFDKQTPLFIDSERTKRQDFIKDVNNNLKYFDDNNFDKIIKDLIITVKEIINNPKFGVKSVLEKYNINVVPKLNNMIMTGGMLDGPNVRNTVDQIYTTGPSQREVITTGVSHDPRNAETDMESILIETSRFSLGVILKDLMIWLIPMFAIDRSDGALSSIIFMILIIIIIFMRIYASPRAPYNSSSYFSAAATTYSIYSQANEGIKSIIYKPLPNAVLDEVGSSVSIYKESIEKLIEPVITFGEKMVEFALLNKPVIDPVIGPVIDTAQYITSHQLFPVIIAIASSEWFGWRDYAKINKLVIRRESLFNFILQQVDLLTTSNEGLNEGFLINIKNARDKIRLLDKQIAQAKLNKGALSRGLRVASNINVSDVLNAYANYSDPYPLLNNSDEEDE
jgi:hypothetical protein